MPLGAHALHLGEWSRPPARNAADATSSSFRSSPKRLGGRSCATAGNQSAHRALTRRPSSRACAISSLVRARYRGAIPPHRQNNLESSDARQQPCGARRMACLSWTYWFRPLRLPRFQSQFGVPNADPQEDPNPLPRNCPWPVARRNPRRYQREFRAGCPTRIASPIGHHHAGRRLDGCQRRIKLASAARH